MFYEEIEAIYPGADDEFVPWHKISEVRRTYFKAYANVCSSNRGIALRALGFNLPTMT